ncbi:hypothetical protein CcaverHIS002_0403450 [Cutaneotrichosporon cavernicola]|uniref:polynucleotide adenylyltransferase n=1 Tax=Cutaneotrichosporon cavernicola TaxID=279322 RepID=A0AA48L3X8_9TREE|nr:uncharacterized protein CcaverHIS019_0403410 [Cutaneotrichosporon cavernicola]BEI83741.1 hypothetical protein CcaverHIS002_0403450 [Cutaneotrichosporon cavernicola]BEI91521.1 hypothetical protein CcaverHIS019_0403410 [Cutaneotrichosporon cavernicola]BEI99296.1 hypothetical protein CcaverHIS631_0403390 [Cutaneotrichosporon cavernicola]BEJ07073.1 hypothetical protein CcaverHIS641_0403420 [Cutaneotrichosporon cavernicola]
MADTSFADGDLFIGLGSQPGSQGKFKVPPPPKGKKRKGEQIGNVKRKRVKHQQHPQPLPGKGKGKPKPQNTKWKEKKDAQSRQIKRSRTAFRELGVSGVSKGSPWADDVDWERCRDPAEMLNEEVTAFYNFVTPTEGEYEVRKHVIEFISAQVRKWKPEMEVVAFGSWQTQLYLPMGDLDLVVVPPLTRPWSNKDTANFLTNLSVVLRNSGIADKIALVLGAKVPIIKFVTRPQYGNIPVDISFNQTNGIDSGKIITHYLDALPGARELITVVKYFLSQRQMNEVFTGGLGSYSVICLVISFMQMHPKLRRAEMDAQRNLGTLLLEFFELYGRSFNYDTVGISIRRGGQYFLKRDRGWTKKAGNPTPFLLSIEDPQNVDNDISGGSYGLPRVKMTFAGAYDMIRQRMFDRAAQILARDAHDKPPRQPQSPDDYSILSCILGVEKDTIDFREHIEGLYEHGDLAADLDAFIQRHNVKGARLQNTPLPPSLQSKRRAHSSDMDLESGETSNAEGGGDGEVEEYKVEEVSRSGAIVIDDSEVSDGASSHTSSSGEDEEEDEVEDRRSVSEDKGLYETESDASDSRYTAAMDAATKRRKGKGNARRDDGAFSAALVEGEEVDELDSTSDEEAPKKPNGVYAASAGPSRTNSPPLRILGASARSAPASPNGRSKRPERWVRPAERARYWAAKSAAEPVDLTNDSD